MKRCLFIACTQFQLLYALQIKHTLLESVPCDIIVLNTKANLEGIREIFDNAVWCRWNEAPPKKSAIKCFIDPIYALQNYYLEPNKLEFDEYTDLFYYGPCWVYYFIYKYYLIKKHDYTGHYYPEGDAGYSGIVGNPPPKWYGSILIAKCIKTIDKYFFKYGVDNISKAKDIYIISPQYMLQESMLPVIRVPKFRTDDIAFISIINRIFDYKHIDLSKRVIFIDGCWAGSREEFYDVEKADKLIGKLGDIFGKEYFWLKRHHAATMNMYSDELKQHISIFEENFPWEIAYINGDVKNCCIIGSESSAITNPFKFGLCKVPVLLITDILNLKIEISRSHVSKIAAEENNIKYIKTEAELLKTAYDIKNMLGII